jgi:peptidoglycan/LPS O-acetylase OafA/YrhL
VGTALVIAAGTALGGSGVEFILRPRPIQWLGARSYSWYLWHWPFLVIAAEAAGHALTVWQNLFWVLLALVASMISYRLIENPARKSKALKRRPLISIALGLCLILASLAIAQNELRTHSGANGLAPPLARVHPPATVVAEGHTGTMRGFRE